MKRAGIFMLLQIIQLFLEGLQFRADVNEPPKDISLSVGTFLVLSKNLTRRCDLEASHLHEVVNQAYLFDILFLILAGLR